MFDSLGFPIRTLTARWLFAPPRYFSQLTTSFIGFRCQGILPLLFLAWSFLHYHLNHLSNNAFLSSSFEIVVFYISIYFYISLYFSTFPSFMFFACKPFGFICLLSQMIFLSALPMFSFQCASFLFMLIILSIIKYLYSLKVFYYIHNNFSFCLFVYSLLSSLFFWVVLMEIKRFELLTPCLQGRCSPIWAIPPYLFFWYLTGSDGFFAFLPDLAVKRYFFLTTLWTYLTFLTLQHGLVVLTHCSTLHPGLKWTRTTDLTLIRRAL